MKEEKRISSKVILAEEETYYVKANKCPLGEDVACCVYSPSGNLHVCPYSGEEVRVNGMEDTGPATSYCTHPEPNEERSFHF